MRRSRVAVILAAGALALVPATAGAHAQVVALTPAPGVELRGPPAVVSATFSEPLNRSLSRLTLTRRGGTAVATRRIAAGPKRLVLKPLARLVRGVYGVRWHSVSAEDGHASDGSYYFGVQVAVPSGIGSSQTSPLAGGGWVRTLLRAMFDGALLVFCGGVFCAALLARGCEPASWLLPDPDEPHAAAAAKRLWRRTIAVGLAAAAIGAVSVLADAANAGQGLSGGALNAYLLSDLSGEARLAVLCALVLAIVLARWRAPARASALAVAALAALTVSGHANAAHARGLAIASDLAHLVAASVWTGGIVLIAWAWLPRLPGLPDRGRRRLAEVVLPRFGRVALPAFLTLAIAGIVNAAIQLGSIQALWNAGYGRVLMVKVALVGAIALVSYTHALRIRPRLLAANPHPDERLERRHWRLLASEPILAAAVVLAAGLVIAYPPPSTAGPQTSGLTFVGSEASLAAVRPGQLSVAEEAGLGIVAAWVTHVPGGLSLQVRTLDLIEHPVALTTRVAGATATGSCGLGCVDARVSGSPSVLSVAVTDHGHVYTAELPIRFHPGSDRLAARLLHKVEISELKLRTAVVHETLRSAPTVTDLTTYELRAPDRFAFQSSVGGRSIGDTIIVGHREWSRSPGQRWQASLYGGGGPAFSAKDYFGWWMPYATQPRLLDRYAVGSDQRADIATLGEVQGGIGPVWFRLRVDLTHGRLLQLRMITAGHFMTQAWGAANAPQPIKPPPPGQVAP